MGFFASECRTKEADKFKKYKSPIKMGKKYIIIINIKQY